VAQPLRAASAALHAEPAVSASGGVATHVPARWEGRFGGAVPLTDGRVHCAADYYTTGGCYVGVAPLGQSANAWEPFDATFAPSDSVVTVYINQEGTAHPAVVRGLAVLQRIGTRFPPAAPSLLWPSCRCSRPSPVRRFPLPLPGLPSPWRALR
jgi:hypothetical protein